MMRVILFLLISSAYAGSLEEDVKDLNPQETQRNLHAIIQSHEGYNFGGVRYPEDQHSSHGNEQQGYNNVYYGKDERDHSYPYYGKDERDHGYVYYGTDQGDQGHAYYGKNDKDHGDQGQAYYVKNDKDHGLAYYGDTEEDRDQGHRYHGHYDHGAGLSKAQKQEHHNQEGKYHERKTYERDRGYHYEKAYAYDKIRIHHDKSNYQKSHGSHYDKHDHQNLYKKGDHGGESYMYFRKMGNNGYDKYGKVASHEDGYKNGLYDNGVQGYGFLIQHAKDGDHKGYY